MNHALEVTQKWLDKATATAISQWLVPSGPGGFLNLQWYFLIGVSYRSTCSAAPSLKRGQRWIWRGVPWYHDASCERSYSATTLRAFSEVLCTYCEWGGRDVAISSHEWLRVGWCDVYGINFTIWTVDLLAMIAMPIQIDTAEKSLVWINRRSFPLLFSFFCLPSHSLHAFVSTAPNDLQILYVPLCIWEQMDQTWSKRMIISHWFQDMIFINTHL